MRVAVLLIVLVMARADLHGQDAGGPAMAMAPQPRLAVSAGLVTGIPGQGDRGAGPFVNATFRVPTRKPGGRWLLGVGYGIVLTDGWTSPEGVNYSFAPEGFIGAFGREWGFGAGDKVGLDLQWNPSVTRVRRWGPDPGWPRESSPWDAILSAASIGLRFTLPNKRGPIVSATGRSYVHLHPYAIYSGELDAGVAVGMSIERR